MRQTQLGAAIADLPLSARASKGPPSRKPFLKSLAGFALPDQVFQSAQGDEDAEAQPDRIELAGTQPGIKRGPANRSTCGAAENSQGIGGREHGFSLDINRIPREWKDVHLVLSSRHGPTPSERNWRCPSGLDFVRTRKDSPPSLPVSFEQLGKKATVAHSTGGEFRIDDAELCLLQEKARRLTGMETFRLALLELVDRAKETPTRACGKNAALLPAAAARGIAEMEAGSLRGARSETRRGRDRETGCRTACTLECRRTASAARPVGSAGFISSEYHGASFTSELREPAAGSRRVVARQEERTGQSRAARGGRGIEHYSPESCKAS